MIFIAEALWGDKTSHETWRKPLNGASPVPGPTKTIGTEESVGNLKLDCLTKIGAQLQQLGFFSRGTARYEQSMEPPLRIL